jgi:hypothetical protein
MPDYDLYNGGIVHKPITAERAREGDDERPGPSLPSENP